MRSNYITLIVFLFGSFSAYSWSDYESTNGSKIIRPFGFNKRQPPTLRSVKLLDFKLGLDAQQTCGYTDWTTAQLMIPKKLLTKDYWKNVGKQTVNRAKEAVAALSGALPSMLACNVSPTFCHILNHAEMMATAEAQLTFDTCQMLDGIGDTSMLQSEELRRCIAKATTRGVPPGEAREYCLVNDNDPYGSKRNKAKETTKKAGTNNWSIDTLFSDMFPEKVKTRNGNHIPLNSGGHKYSRRVQTLRFAKQLFSGIEVSGGSTIRRGGTFQPTVDEEIASEMNLLEDSIISALKEMIQYQQKGFSKKDIISKTEYLWKNKNKWEKEGKPHPFYRAASDGTEPTLLITPEQVLMLSPLAGNSNKNLSNLELKQVINRLSRSISNIKIQDKAADLYARAIDTCTKPNHQSAIAQKNCRIIIDKAEMTLKIASIKQEAEHKALIAQREVGDIIEGIQRSRLKSFEGHSSPLSAPNNSKLRVPWQ